MSRICKLRMRILIVGLEAIHLHMISVARLVNTDGLKSANRIMSPTCSHDSRSYRYCVS